MTPHFLTRILTLGLLALSALLVSCGSSTINDPFRPTRVIVFGDSFSFISTTAAYTVNDASTNNWASQIAASYGVSTIVNNAAGNAVVADVQTQVNTFGAAYQAGDLVIVSAGYRDIINNAVSGGASTTTAASNGAAYATLVRAMVANGAKHIAVTNVYDLSKTPAAGIVTNLATLNGARGALVVAFNDALKSNLGSSLPSYIGDNVRLVDLEAYFNLVRTSYTTYSFVDTTTVVCASPTNTGLGLGSAQVNSSVCNAGTLNPAATATTYTTPAYNNYVFADAVYPTPAFHRAWGSNVYTQLIARW